jgi:hypothetical protein
METLLIVGDCIALVGLMIWVVQNEGGGPGPVTGLFRYRLTPQRKPDVRPSGQPRQLPRSRRATIARK